MLLIASVIYIITLAHNMYNIYSSFSYCTRIFIDKESFRAGTMGIYSCQDFYAKPSAFAVVALAVFFSTVPGYNMYCYILNFICTQR